MLIQGTKKLLDDLKVEVNLSAEEDPLYAWHANLLKLGRKKTLVLVNDKTRYVLVLFGLKAKDIKSIESLINQAIVETFEAENIRDEVIEQFIDQSKGITFTKTKDRTSVARMNKSAEALYYFDEYLNPDVIIQPELSRRMNTMLVGNGKNNYMRPNEEMYKCLKETAEQPVFQSEAFVLNVTLNLENHSVWREIIVPGNITLDRLHRVLQHAFNWQNSHLHDFEVFLNQKNDKVISINEDMPALNLVCSQEAFNYQGDIPMEMETGVKLADYLPAKIVYNYDFGDDWKHTIEVKDVIYGYDINYPKCIGGEGTAPPEDVGGEGGYEEFLHIIQNENDPEHESMMEWGKMQGYKEFDIETINWRLKEDS